MSITSLAKLASPIEADLAVRVCVRRFGWQNRMVLAAWILEKSGSSSPTDRQRVSGSRQMELTELHP